jgi:hypothetical protein
MANELSYSISATETKNGVTFSKSFTSLLASVSGDSPISNLQTIGTSDETLDIGDISTVGFIFAKNLDSTNYVQIGYTSGTYFGRLKPGEACGIRLDASVTAVHAKANTGAIKLEYLLFPD